MGRGVRPFSVEVSGLQKHRNGLWRKGGRWTGIPCHRAGCVYPAFIGALRQLL